MRGPESTGHAYGVNVDVKCPGGTKPIVLWHCLPAGEIVYLPGKSPMRAFEAVKVWPDSDTHKANELVGILTDDGRLNVTPNHILNTFEGWKLAGQLTVKDKLILGNKKRSPSQIKIVERFAGDFTVYDFHTPDKMLYAGTVPFMTHNTHPQSGNLHPSDADMKAARDNNIPWLCVHIPENGALACYPVVGVQ